MSLHPRIAQLIDDLTALNAPHVWDLTLEEARAAHLQRRAWGGPLVEMASSEDVRINGTLPIRIYRPVDATSLPVIVWLHGGGWVVGSIEAQEPVCRMLAARSHCAVVAVDYRLAPEHRFPAAMEDAESVLAWIEANAAQKGLDVSRVAIGGDSAGANLAAVAALHRRDNGSSLVKFQALVYPAVDATMQHASYTELATGYMLTAAHMRWYYDQYARGVDARHPDLSPLYAASHAGLPPALVLTAEYDPLRDEGEDYAHCLQQAGVAVKLLRCAGLVHGFFAMGGIVDTADAALTEIANAVRDALHA